MKTVMELMGTDIATADIDIITVNHNGKVTQYDSVGSLIYCEGDSVVIDYEIEYDAEQIREPDAQYKPFDDAH